MVFGATVHAIPIDYYPTQRVALSSAATIKKLGPDANHGRSDTQRGTLTTPHPPCHAHPPTPSTCAPCTHLRRSK